MAVTAGVSHVLSGGARKVAEADFRLQAAATRDLVQKRIQAQELVLRGAAGFFNASGGRVDRVRWKTYVDGLELHQRLPGIQGLGYTQRILAPELEAHHRALRAEGFPDYAVRPPDPRPEYFSIIYLEPFDARNRRAFGYDMFTEATRRAAMERARDTAKCAVSGRVKLVQETESDIQPGFLMYFPVYAPGLPVESVADKRRALQGFVYSPFRMKDLMAGVLGGASRDVDLEIYDGGTASESSLLYDDDAIPHALDPKSPRLFRNVERLDVLGHEWLLVVTSTPAFELRSRGSTTGTVYGIGFFISVIVAMLIWSLGSHQARAYALASEMTRTVRERESFIRALIDNAVDGIIAIDESGRILDFNRAAATIFGWSADEVMGRNVSMLMPEPHRSGHDGYLSRYVREGKAQVIGIGREVEGLRKDGSLFPMDLAVSEMVQDGRRIFTGLVRDITDRKRADEALVRSEERFQLAINGADDGLWDWDLSTDRVYFSPRWKSMLGCGDDEIGDQFEEWRSRVHPDDLEESIRNVKRHLSGETPLYRSEMRMRHKNGEYLWILARGLAQRNAKGEPLRMVGIHTDITERKIMERMKSEFVSTVSHELRTPLTAIRGSLGLLSGGMGGPISAEGAELLAIASRNTERLLHIINDLLDMEKIQSGSMEFAMKPVEVMPMVERAIENNRSYAAEFQVSLGLVERVGGECCLLDEHRFGQIMANLLSNAAKFSRPGESVDIAVNRDGDHVSVSVRDRGEGIPESFQKRIFQKFTQADSTDRKSRGGTGLGLNITRALVERMGGEIGFETSPGEGTTFTVKFPVVARPGLSDSGGQDQG